MTHMGGELEELRDRMETLRQGVKAAKLEAQRADTIGAHMFLLGMQTALNIMEDSGIRPPVDPAAWLIARRPTT